MANIGKMMEYLEQAEQYINYITDIVTDPNEQPAKKQVTFLDNQDQIQDCMKGLEEFKNKCDKLLSSKGDDVKDYDVKDYDDIVKMKKESERLITSIKNAAELLKKQLSKIDPNTNNEDNQVKVTVDTVNEAIKNNRTTMEISQNMNDIANGNYGKSIMPTAKYALVVNGKTTFIQANDMDTLNNKIQKVLNGYDGQDVALYEVKYSRMQLKTKTVYSVV